MLDFQLPCFLVGGLEHFIYFPFHIWDVILPIDELKVFKMVIAPPTRLLLTITSSTAQGGGGSFKNRKPIGEVGCCESGMAKRIH